MFLDHFGLIEQPFGVTPDPRFLHMGVKHREALASLLYGTDCNRGFLALIAEPGMGKTSLLYQYLEGLRGKARTAFVFQTNCDTRDFMPVGAAIAYNYVGGSFDPANPDLIHRPTGITDQVTAYIDGSSVSAGGNVVVTAGYTAPTVPGDYFEAKFDAEEDTLVFRRIATNKDWLAVLKECTVSMDDVPPRRRELPRPATGA